MAENEDGIPATFRPSRVDGELHLTLLPGHGWTIWTLGLALLVSGLFAAGLVTDVPAGAAMFAMLTLALAYGWWTLFQRNRAGKRLVLGDEALRMPGLDIPLAEIDAAELVGSSPPSLLVRMAGNRGAMFTVAGHSRADVEVLAGVLMDRARSARDGAQR